MELVAGTEGEMTMSYTPDNQFLRQPLHSLISSIAAVCDVIDERIASGDYTDSHISEVTALANELSILKRRLMKLAQTAL